MEAQATREKREKTMRGIEKTILSIATIFLAEFDWAAAQRHRASEPVGTTPVQSPL
jgi:hypothetical protein